MELECIVSGLLKRDEKKAREDINAYIHVHHYDSDGVHSYACEKPIINNTDTLMCRTTVSPCNKADSGIYFCTIKIDGKEFSSAIQDVKIDSDKMDLIEILGSSIGVLFLVAILTLVIINSAGCIYINYRRRHPRAAPPPPPPVPGQPGPQPQPLPQAHIHRRAQPPQQAPPPRRAQSPQYDRLVDEQEPLLLGDEQGIEENQSNVPQFAWINISYYGTVAVYLQFHLIIGMDMEG